MLKSFKKMNIKKLFNIKKNFFTKRKVFIMLSIVILLLTAVTIIYQKSYAFNGANGTSGNCTWTIDTSGKMTIRPTSGSSCTLSTATSEQMPWYNNREYITSVVVNSGVKANANSAHLFRDLLNATSINVSNLDTSSATDMGQMFRNCNSLTSLNLSSFNTSNVTNMNDMFNGCSSLTSINFGNNFNTSNVTNMGHLFTDCSSLTSLNLSGFNTSSAQYIDYMFSNCNSLTSLDLSSFNTSNVIDMSYMFWKCSSLEELNLGNDFTTNSATNMGSVFNGCSSLTSLDVSNFTTNNVTNMDAMFRKCSSLTSLNLSNFNTSNVTDMDYMFQDCHALTSLDLSSFRMNSNPTIVEMIQNIGNNKNEGTKLTLNNAFNKTYSTGSNYYFPYSYYAKEVNGELSNELYTLSAMQTETTGSNTPTTWVPAYRVDYNKGSGESISGDTPQIYRIGSKINTTGLSGVKIGSIFENWNTKADGTGTVINKDAESTNSYGDKYTSVGTNNAMTLYAQYVEHTSTLIANANGGIIQSTPGWTGTGDAASKDIGYNVAYGTLPTTTREGYTFIEWNTKSDGTGSTVTSSTTMGTADTTIYAKWRPHTYTVKYNANGGEGTMADSSYEYDEQKSLRANEFTKEGHRFAGWNTKSDGTGAGYTNEENVSNLTSEDGGIVNLYAQYIQKSNAKIFHSNGTEVEKDSSNNYIIKNEAKMYEINYISDNNGTIDPAREVVRSGENPLLVGDVPNEGYKLLMIKCNKDVILDNGTTIVVNNPITADKFRKIKMDRDLNCRLTHKPYTAKVYNCEP